MSILEIGPAHVETAVGAFLLAFSALFSIVNPIGGALIFDSATAGRSPADKQKMALRIGLYSFIVLLTSLWLGGYARPSTEACEQPAPDRALDGPLATRTRRSEAMRRMSVHADTGHSALHAPLIKAASIADIQGLRLRRQDRPLVHFGHGTLGRREFGGGSRSSDRSATFCTDLARKTLRLLLAPALRGVYFTKAIYPVQITGIFMKTLALHLFKTNADLSNFVRSTSNLQDTKSRRSSVRIAVIDDQPFLPHMILQTYGYKVEQIGDLKSVEEVKNYHLILCDVMGVGRHFGAKAQGATLISEIKKVYPEKIVIAYTGGAAGDPAIQAATERADALIRKDVDGEEWAAKLDELGIAAIDPHIIWHKVRTRFVELDVDTKDILLLEDAFVRSVLSKRAYPFKSYTH